MKKTTNNGDGVTIVDVANLAGVSIATVSRVINGYSRILPRTRKRVQRAIEQLSYHPNVHARRLVTQSVDTICYLLCNRSFLNRFHAGILTGVERAASSLQHEVLYTTFSYSAETPAAELDLPPILQRAGAVGGVILAGTNYPNLLQAVRERRIPFIVFANNLVQKGRPKYPLEGVFYDDGSPSYEITQRLIAMGHKRIAFVGDLTQPWWLRRRTAFRQALKEHHLRSIEYSEPLTNAVEYGEEAVARLMAGSRKPTAIFAGNDLIAFGVWRQCRKLGISIPGDVSLIGFDDMAEATLMDPTLTTVHVPVEEVGQECVHMIVEKMRKPDVVLPERLIGTHVVSRESWGPAPGER